MNKWDNYFLEMCNVVAKNSTCFSRQIGAVLVRDNIIISTGYNGPPRGVPDCYERMKKDKRMQIALNALGVDINDESNIGICPRKLLQFPSGQGLEWCPAIHSEKNCLLSAARNGICTKGATIYLNSEVSCCSQCFGALINAGIKEVVLIKNNFYDATVEWMMSNSNIKIREFGEKERRGLMDL